uniref:RING-type domain-containing protein n=1 Tax=Macrostomum lignano TaxID=282301 RepID=A0A1I8J4J9_9PLAT
MLSQAVAAARAAARCPICDTDWTRSALTSSTEVRRLPACGHAVCIGCYANRWRLATNGRVVCPTCGVACREKPDGLPADAAAAVEGIGRLLAHLASQQQRTLLASSKQSAGGSHRPQVRQLELWEPCYSPEYLAKRRAVEAVDSDTGQHLASLQIEGLRQDRTLTSLCLRRHGQEQRHLLAADRYRDRLHVVDLSTGRCVQTYRDCSRPKCLWADEELALVSTRDGTGLLVLGWDQSDRLSSLGSVSAISGRSIAGLRCAVAAVSSDGSPSSFILILHRHGVSALDRRQLLRRFRRAVSALGTSGGGEAAGQPCDVPADGQLDSGEFGLADCSAMTASCGCRREKAAGGGGGGQEGVPSNGIRVLQRRGSAWLLLATVRCRCRCGRCFAGCTGCWHQPRLLIDGLAYDEAGRRLIVSRRGTNSLQIVKLP